MVSDTKWTEADHQRLLSLSAWFQLRLEHEFPGYGLQAFMALTLGSFGELVRVAEDPDVLRTGLNEQLSDTSFRLVRVS
jgi:hypothetical protein